MADPGLECVVLHKHNALPRYISFSTSDKFAFENRQASMSVDIAARQVLGAHPKLQNKRCRPTDTRTHSAQGDATHTLSKRSLCPISKFLFPTHIHPATRIKKLRRKARPIDLSERPGTYPMFFYPIGFSCKMKRKNTSVKYSMKKRKKHNWSSRVRT